jgi:hypothetical protein
VKHTKAHNRSEVVSKTLSRLGSIDGASRETLHELNLLASWPPPTYQFRVYARDLSRSFVSMYYGCEEQKVLLGARPEKTESIVEFLSRVVSPYLQDSIKYDAPVHDVSTPASREKLSRRANDTGAVADGDRHEALAGEFIEKTNKKTGHTYLDPVKGTCRVCKHTGADKVGKSNPRFPQTVTKCSKCGDCFVHGPGATPL